VPFTAAQASLVPHHISRPADVVRDLGRCAVGQVRAVPTAHRPMPSQDQLELAATGGADVTDDAGRPVRRDELVIVRVRRRSISGRTIAAELI
jgi:hypothetical protein